MVYFQKNTGSKTSDGWMKSDDATVDVLPKKYTRMTQNALVDRYDNFVNHEKNVFFRKK